MNIYRVLKKHYGDEIKQQYDELQKEQKEGEGKSESKSEGNGEGNDESVSESESKNVMRRAMPSMEQMKEEAEQKAATMTEEELEKGIEDFDENNPHAMGGLTDSAGNIALSPSPEQALRAQYDAYLTCEVEKAVSKLKNLVKGNQVKTRVKTYSRQSRKDSPDGLIRKGTKNEKALAPRILVAMDSSGSMSSTTVTPIAKAIGSIAKSVGKTKGSYICEHDGVVGNIQPLSKWEEVVKNYYPSGDNDFDLVLEKAIELGVQVVLNIGDGYCKFFKQYTIRRAAEKGIKWIDVQVTGEYDLLKRIREADEKRYVGCIGKFIDWEIIKVGEDD